MSRAQRGVKKVVASIAMEVVLEGVRGYLEELIRPITPEHLYQAIIDNVNPWEYAPTRVKRKGSVWASQLRKYQDRLTSQLVLEWLKADRPDLASLIENMGSKGTKWLARWTESIKVQLWPPEGGLKLVQEGTEEEEKPPEKPKETPQKIKWG